MPAPIVGAAVIGGAAALGSGILNYFGARDRQRRQDRARNDAFNILSDLNPLEAQALNYNPQNYATPTDINPILANQYDPTYHAAKMEAFNRSQNLAKEGLSLEDKLAIMNAEKRGGLEARSREDAIKRDLERQGVSGSGQEYVMRQVASQMSGDRISQMGMERAALAARQKVLWNQQQLNTASQLDQERYNRSLQTADRINMYNEKNTLRRAEVARQNVQMGNQATLLNMQNIQKMDIMKQKSIQDIAKAKANAKIGQANAATQSPWVTGAQGFLQTGANVGMGAYGLMQNQDYIDTLRSQRMANAPQYSLPQPNVNTSQTPYFGYNFYGANNGKL